MSLLWHYLCTAGVCRGSCSVHQHLCCGITCALQVCAEEAAQCTNTCAVALPVHCRCVQRKLLSAPTPVLWHCLCTAGVCRGSCSVHQHLCCGIACALQVCAEEAAQCTNTCAVALPVHCRCVQRKLLSALMSLLWHYLCTAGVCRGSCSVHQHLCCGITCALQVCAEEAAQCTNVPAVALPVHCRCVQRKLLSAPTPVLWHCLCTAGVCRGSCSVHQHLCCGIACALQVCAEEAAQCTNTCAVALPVHCRCVQRKLLSAPTPVLWHYS
ncbi:keratin-associated protein 10-3-like [Serinus canaria]|uniref:keratin-associated protein 10-3-like n=1 Tax=Serinus canaria TaxID=9135 RepID=UPI0021CCB726|nr:keratin-associated protein 10-3-like [Serinus canaria]